MGSIETILSANEGTQSVRSCILTSKEAAELLKVSIRTLEDWRLRGGGPEYVKIGSLVRYRMADLASYLQARIQSNTGQNRSARQTSR